MKYFLAILAIIILGGAGYFFWTQNNTPIETPTGKRPASEGYATLGGLGVQITVPDVLQNMVQTSRTVQTIGEVVGISTTDLKKVSELCELGTFYKIEKASLATQRTKWTEETLKAATLEESGVLPQAKEFENFYLVFEPSQAACSSDAEKIEQESAQREALWKSLQTATSNGI